MTELYGTQKGVREIALTFDDGPNASTTPRLLDVLAAHDIKALFFMVGRNIATDAGRQIMERAHREGHLIGNHTYTHPSLVTLSDDQIRDELQKTQDLIGDCGHESRLFRPPYGATNVRVNAILREEGYDSLLWNVDTMDWKYKQDGHWVDHGMEQVESREDCIVLMHDIHPTTVDNVERLVTRINSISNTQFVSMA